MHANYTSQVTPHPRDPLNHTWDISATWGPTPDVEGVQNAWVLLLSGQDHTKTRTEPTGSLRGVGLLEQYTSGDGTPQGLCSAGPLSSE